MNKRLFLDIHIIQTLPPSNVNRDDTGSPKTAQYGGVLRARVSSQAWKKAVRDYFKDNYEIGNLGVRTRNLDKYLKEIIGDESKDKNIKEILTGLKINIENKKDALFFISHSMITKIKEFVLEGRTSKEDIEQLKNLLQNDITIDIALFGRMLAADPELNEDASCQVAHAISTHRVDTEFDYFTAIDDLNPKNNSGAAMLDNAEFNSSTLYRYANVSLHSFYQQMRSEKELFINSVKLFIESFVKSLPTGKINSFANQTLPQLVVLTLREDRPVNLVSAFETPIKSSNGFVDPSVGALVKGFEKSFKFVKKPIYNALVSTSNYDFNDSFGISFNNFDEMVEQIANAISQLIN